MVLFLLKGVFAAPWDFLRIPIELASTINPIVIGLLVIVSLIVMLISLIALKKRKTQKIAFVSLAFILFFIKAVLVLTDLYFSPGIFMNFAVQGFFDLLIVASLFMALFRK
jgi:uncharacterized membrane protein